LIWAGNIPYAHRSDAKAGRLARALGKEREKDAERDEKGREKTENKPLKTWIRVRPLAPGSVCCEELFSRIMSRMRRYLKKYLPDQETIRSNPWLRPFQSSLLHPRLWHLNRHSAAGAVATGLFCGLIPGPLQMIGAALAAVKFRINLPLALLVTLYTNPFTIVPLYLVAYQLGRLLTGDSAGFIAPPEFSITAFAAWTEAMQGWMLVVAKPLGLGLLALASVLSVFGYLATRAIWRLYLIKAWRVAEAPPESRSLAARQRSLSAKPCLTACGEGCSPPVVVNRSLPSRNNGRQVAASDKPSQQCTRRS
jgi:uncharacterized protein (DUF2062 family)